MATPSPVRSGLLQLLAVLVAVSGAAGVAGLVGVDVASRYVWSGDGWGLDTWGLVAAAGAACAAVAAALGRRRTTVVALVAAVLTTFAVVLGADPGAQSPYGTVPGLLGSLAVLVLGAFDAWAIGVEAADR